MAGRDGRSGACPRHPRHGPPFGLCGAVAASRRGAAPLRSRRLRRPAPAHPHALARAGEGYGVGLSPRPRRGDSCFRRPARIVGRDPIAGTGGTLAGGDPWPARGRSEEHTSELQSLMRISYAGLCLKKKTYNKLIKHIPTYLTSPVDKQTTNTT